MPATEPRLLPVEGRDMPEKALEALRPYRNGDGDGDIYAIWATLSAHPDALRRFLVFGNHVTSPRCVRNFRWPSPATL